MWSEATPESLRAVEEREFQAVGIECSIPLLDEHPEMLKRFFRTGWLVERPVTVIGLVPVLPGVFEGFALLSDAALDHGLAVARYASLGLSQAERVIPGLRRIQAVCDVGDAVSLRWLSFLGFEREGTLRRYGLEGQDVVMHGRTR